MPKILIVDDEAPIRTLLRSAVPTAGFTVFEADCGPRALEIAAQQGAFDLVVTDVLMPGMDGFDLAAELQRGGHADSFVFMSGYYDSELLTDRLVDFPDSAFLSKPFPIPEFLGVLRRLIPASGDASSAMRRTA